MPAKYDDFFQWLKAAYSPEQVNIKQDIHPNPDDKFYGPDVALMDAPAELDALPYKGLELLVGKDLIIGNSCFIAGNQTGIMIGAQKSSIYDFAFLPNINIQVFEVPHDKAVRNDAVFPLVARVSTNSHVTIEYCAKAQGYWNGHR